MTANQDAAWVVLTRMGVGEADQTDALAATENVVRIFRPHDPLTLTAEWECAAELVGAFAAVTGYTGSDLRQVSTIARAAYKMKRY